MNLRKIQFIILIALQAPAFLFADKPKHNIKIQINGLKDTICYLANYYGDKEYFRDTAKVDSKGYCEFKGDEKLLGGIYLVVMPDEKKWFELIIDSEQSFSVETDTSDFIGKMKIKGSIDNQRFYDYLRFVDKEQKEAEPLRNLLEKVKNNKDSTKLLQDKLAVIDKDVQNYKLDFIAKHPDSFQTKVFNASREPDIPEAPLLPNGKKDSTFAYRYYKQHFFDYIDLTDDRLLRTPVFHNKLKQYITTVVVQYPDSIIKEADTLVTKTKGNKEMFKYVVWYVTNWSESSNIMGFDAIFVHMVEKYYNTNQAYWVTPANLEKITNRAKVLKGLLLGNKIPNVTLQDTSGVYITLYNVQAKYTILYFWDPTCGHCQKETPKLKNIYDSLKVLKRGVEVYAVCADQNLKKEWKKYIIEHKLDWINVTDAQNVTGFHTTYDIYSTPVVYLLDENKVLLAKRLSVEQLKEFLDHQFKKKESKPK